MILREGFTIKTFLKFFHCWEISFWFFVSDFLLNSFPSHKISTLPLKKSHFENRACLILFFKTLELNCWNLIVIFWVILWLQNWKLRILISTKPKIKKGWKCSFLRENFSKSLYSLNLKVCQFTFNFQGWVELSGVINAQRDQKLHSWPFHPLNLYIKW